jgi:hypothetical protein
VGGAAHPEQQTQIEWFAERVHAADDRITQVRRSVDVVAGLRDREPGCSVLAPEPTKLGLHDR